MPIETISQQEEWQNLGTQVSKLIARTWLDDSFKEKLLTDPKTTLEAEGIFVPDEVEVQIDRSPCDWQIQIEPSQDKTSVVYKIPLPPQPDEITDEELTSWMNGTDSTPFFIAKS